MRLRQLKRLPVLLVVALVLPSAAIAADLGDGLHIYGFGGWAVGNSDPYPYLAGGGEGEQEYDNVEFVLGLSSEVSEDVQIFAQLFLEDGDEGQTTEIEIATAQWSISDATKLRFGRSRMPFGVYTEILDAGTLRPFFHLPQSIYGPTGFVAKSYDGMGLSGYREGGSGWGLAYDVYGGGVKLEVSEPFEEAVEEEEEEGEEEDKAEEAALEGAEGDLENLLGFRLSVTTPIDGLSLGVSAYAAEPESAGDTAQADEGEAVAGVSWGDVNSFGLHAEYLSGPWAARVEVGEHEEPEFTVESSYLELARKLSEKWEIAGRVESVSIKEFQEELPIEATSLLEHDEVAFGLNYWVNPSFVLKLSYHQVDGNLFAFPGEEEELREAVSEGELEDSTDLIVFGAHFSF